MNETLNASINETINATSSGIPDASQIFTTILPALLLRFWELLIAPIKVPSMIYIITPMLITLVMMELYFGRYVGEDLGWNTAVGNSLVLIFVGVDLLKTTFPGQAPLSMLASIWFSLVNFSSQTGLAVSTLITVALLALAFLLLICNFFHLLGERLAFFISGSLQINLLAYLAIVIVYTHNAGKTPIPFDWYTLGAAVLLYLLLRFLFGFIHLLEPKYQGSWKMRKKLKALAEGKKDG